MKIHNTKTKTAPLRIQWRSLSLVVLLLGALTLGAIFYQTSQAEKLLQQAYASTTKGNYAQAYSQLNKANLVLVWPTTSQKIATAKNQNKQFEGYAASLAQVNQLIADTKLDEASSALGKVDKAFPEYAKAQALQRIVAEQKAAIANQLEVDSSPLSGPIQIVGDTNCQTSTQAALNLLKAKAPAHYAVVQGYIGVIECIAQGSGMYATQKPPKFVAGDVTRNAGTIWYAGALAHDAGHSKLYRDYKASHLGQTVPDDAWSGEGAEKACLDAQYDALTKLGATGFQLDSVQNALKTKYYNVSQAERWW